MATRGMNLLALQREIRDHLLHGRPDVGRLVRGEAAPRLAVYHNAYRMQLLACLRDTYEKTHAWLGHQNFDAAGLEHIASHTPVSWTLNDYDLNFDQTLAARYPDDPEVAELAWLEWALRRAFDGPDASPIAADGLTQIDWDHVVI